MANHFQTVSNVVNTFGPQQSNEWGTLTWTLTSASTAPGFRTWGYGFLSTQIERVFKVIGNTLSPSSEVIKKTAHLSDNTFVVSGFEIDEQTLRDGGVWKYQFVRPTTDADLQVTTSWTSG